MPKPYSRHAREVRSEILRLVALHDVDSRAEIAVRTGLSASAAGGHVDSLIASGALVETGTKNTGSRGRPPYRLAVAPRGGVVLVAELGTGGAQLAIGNLDGSRRATELIEIDVRDGPTTVLGAVCDRLDAMLVEHRLTRANVMACVIVLPGPVDDNNGMVVRPTVMPGWNGYPVASDVGNRFRCPLEVHNDANMMAAGEALTLSPDELPMIYLKLGMSLGCGLVLADGTVFHGRDGGAGDIAHIRAPGNSGELCACGNLGCVEAVASTSAILNRLEGTPGLTADRPRNSWTLLALLESGDPHALRATREAAAVIGEATVLLVHLLNPATILIGGPLGTDDVIASIRGTVYQRAPSLLTRSLRIRAAPLGTYSGVTGGLRRAIEIALTPDQLTRLTDVTTGTTGGHGAVPAPAQ